MTITKTTEQLNHEIKEAGNIQDFLVSNQNNILTTSLSEHLRTLLFEKNLQKKDIIHNSLRSEEHTSELQSQR